MSQHSVIKFKPLLLIDWTTIPTISGWMNARAGLYVLPARCVVGDTVIKRSGLYNLVQCHNRLDSRILVIFSLDQNGVLYVIFPRLISWDSINKCYKLQHHDTEPMTYTPGSVVLLISPDNIEFVGFIECAKLGPHFNHYIVKIAF